MDFWHIVIRQLRSNCLGSIISAAIITFAEVFVHRYLFNHIETKHTARTRPAFKRKLAYDTEFAEEQHVENKENPK